MSDLHTHFKSMQSMASRFLEPGEYIDRNGDGFDKDAGQRAAFINDMLHMLDGPEQREVQTGYQELLDKADEVKHLEARVAVLQSELKQAHSARQPLADENNDLRSRLMTSELAYARLRGYLDRTEDERPPVMVAQHRERAPASMPDGTMGTDYGGWRGGNSTQERKWFHK